MQVRDKHNKSIEYVNIRNRFVAIDFETLNEFRGSVCSVGVVVIENNKITKKYHSYICPPTKDENYYCTLTHGLHYNDVCKYPNFSVIWEKVDAIIDDCPLIAHNAGFERSCINACNELFDTKNDYLYIDTVALSKKYLNGLRNYKLDTVCESIKYNLRHHHNALEDAIACAKVFVKINKKNKITESDD